MGHERIEDSLERVDLAQHYGKTTVESWAQGHPASWQYKTISVGQLADGRWWVARTAQTGSGSWLAADEAQAYEAAGQFRERGHRGDMPWRPRPAAYDAFGQPDDGRRWRKTGQVWELDDDDPSSAGQG